MHDRYPLMYDRYLLTHDRYPLMHDRYPLIQILYVDIATGSDYNGNDGTTEETAVKTIRKAATLATDSTAIYVKNGSYPNWNYGEGAIDNPGALTFTGLNDTLLSAYPGHFPKIPFDGSSGR